eukprot:10167664-Alexandrium_andersonii.AAC.1
MGWHPARGGRIATPAVLRHGTRGGTHRTRRTRLRPPHGLAGGAVAPAPSPARRGRAVHARELARDCRAAPRGHQDDPR